MSRLKSIAVIGATGMLGAPGTNILKKKICRFDCYNI